MDPNVIPNGGGETIPNGLSPAEQLQQKHAADEAHRVSIEDAIDEEDIQHPPPSVAGLLHALDAASVPVIQNAHEPISEVAAGKQKAQDKPLSQNVDPRRAEDTKLDTKSEDSFPALGGQPRSRPPAPVATAWGAKKPTLVGKSAPNGVNGHNNVSSAASSRPSTPASGILTPSSTNTSLQPQTRTTSQYMPMPGRHSERIQFAPSQLLPRHQLKKPVLDVLRDINKRSKATVEMKPGPGGVICFEGIGPMNAVRQALKDVAKEVGSKQAVKVPIPASVRPHVIGKKGTVVDSISLRTGARIQVPKVDGSVLPNDDDDSSTVDVTIEGDAVAAEMARREIETIVNERTSSVKMRLKDIPAEFYPFICGPHNTRINALEQGRDVTIRVPSYHTWTNQPPPEAPARQQLPHFQPHPHSHIHISGDRHAAQEARAEIERHVEDLRRQITLSQLAIDRGRHQFVVGDKGASLHQFLEETGCAVILPPESDNTEFLSITGPHDKIDLGIERVMNLATSMQMSSVDIARQHLNASQSPQVHARALTKYLQQRQAIAQLERLHDSRIVLPATEDGPTTWEVYSREGKNTIRARSDIMNLINAHPPSRLRQVNVDPFFHSQIQRQAAQTVRANHGVHLLVPEETEQSPQILLVFEGTGNALEYDLPKQRPSPAEIAQFETGLRDAEDYILGMIRGQEELSSRSLTIPTKFHDRIQKFIQREQQGIPTEKFPVRFYAGESSSNSMNGFTCEPIVRGPRDDVEDFVQRILAFVEAEKQDEIERDFTLNFEFPQKHANHLIGRGGENIKGLCEEFDVEIHLNEGRVEVKGPKVKAEAAKAKILALGKKIEDESTHVLKIQPQYHREMIGAKGSQINRLQDRYNVRVQFPRSAPADRTRDDQSVADHVSEAGGLRNSRPNQAQDEVIIRGPKRGADEARDELLSLLQWTIDNSHTTTVSVAQNQLPSLIGQGGREMESMRLSTGAQIDIPSNRDSSDMPGRIEINLKGNKQQVGEAKKLLEQRAKAFDDTIVRTVDIDKKYHKTLIGSGGANIRSIVIQAGGLDDRRELARTVRFPRQESDERTIRVEGIKTLVDKIIASIENFASQHENQITETVEVVPEKHRLLIGRGGETRRALESRFGVSVDIPRLSQEGPSRSQIKIVGQPGDVENARAHILDIVKDQEGETMQIPRKLHYIISDEGRFLRRLRNDHGVSVDHAGQHPPRKALVKPRTRINGGEALPLITEDQNDSDHISWEVLDGMEDGEEGEIPWILRGSPENVAKARSMLQKALDQAGDQRYIGYLILQDPRVYRHIIGPGGSQINSIRKQTGCRITVPRDQIKGEAIQIAGGRDGVERAKEIILETVGDGGIGFSSSRKD